MAESFHMKWHDFLDDPEIDTCFSYQPPEKHLVGKMMHDVLESITAMLGWSRMGEELRLTDQLTEPAHTWLVRNMPTLQHERARIYALSGDFLDHTDTLAGWLERVDDIGKSALRVAALNDDLNRLPQATTILEQRTIDVIRRNLLKLALIGKDIQNHEYKRLWTLDYHDLVQML
jgi:hypothetical protein